MEGSNRFKVRLESYNQGTSSTPTSSIVFDVMPAIVESIAVEYQSMDPVHLPGSYFTYKGTKARTFELSDLKFVSRNTTEATQNQAYVNVLRGWTRSYFGMGANDGPGKNSSLSAPIGKKVPNTYKQKILADQKVLSPLTDADIQNILNTRTARLSMITGIDPLKVRHYNSKDLNDPKAVAFLHSEGVTAQWTNYLDNLSAEAANKMRVYNASDKYIPAGAIVRIPGTQPQAVPSTAENSAVKQAGLKFLGAPPDVLYLTAYSDARDKGGELDRTTNIFRIPVVITALTINYPNDVDYIPTIEGQPFPIIMGISLSLTESHSPREFEKFDLFKYREGILPGF